MEDKTVLFIDEDNFFKKVYNRKLEEKGAEFIHAEDVRDAKDTLKERKPDLIITELNLTGGDGFEFVEELKGEIPIIILTELAQDGDKDRAEDLNVEEYFVKSEINISDVMEKIEEIFD